MGCTAREFVPAPILHEFVLSLVDEPDPRSVNAIAVKRRWLRGKATREAQVAVLEMMLEEAIDEEEFIEEKDKPLSEWTLGEVKAHCASCGDICDVCKLSDEGDCRLNYGDGLPENWELKDKPVFTEVELSALILGEGIMAERDRFLRSIAEQPAIDPIHAAGGCYCRECRRFMPYTEWYKQATKWADGACGALIMICIDHQYATRKEDDFCSYGEPKEVQDDEQ